MSDSIENTRRKRSGGGLWNVLSGLLLVATLGLCGLYTAILVNPALPLNPFPPPTLTPLATPSPLPTVEPTASQAASATLTGDAQASATPTLVSGAGGGDEQATPSPTGQTPASARSATPVTSPTSATATLTATLEPTATAGGDGGYPGDQTPFPTQGGYPAP